MAKRKTKDNCAWIVCMRCGGELSLEHIGNCTHCGKSPSMMGFELYDDPKDAKRQLLNEIDFIRNTPPSCIKRFATRRTKVVKDPYDATVQWEIGCKCGCTTGSVRGYKTADYDGWISPLSMTCDDCQKARIFFDESLHGLNRAYDDDDGPSKSVRPRGKKTAVQCPKCLSGSFTVRLTFANPDGSGVDLEDEPQYAKRCQDFFDRMSCRCICTKCRKAWTFAEFECS